MSKEGRTLKKTILVDARGLECPQPVVKTKEALEQNPGAKIEVLVDNPGSSENVARFARHEGRQVESMREGGTHRIVISPGVSPPKRPEREQHEEPLSCARTGKGLLLYIGADQMGRGSEELGKKLLRGFLRTWLDSEQKPWRIIFINSGVRITTLDGEAVEALELLAEKGVEILSCGTCLEHFRLRDSLRVGRITNMYEIVETLCAAAQVISPA